MTGAAKKEQPWRFVIRLKRLIELGRARSRPYRHLTFQILLCAGVTYAMLEMAPALDVMRAYAEGNGHPWDPDWQSDEQKQIFANWTSLWCACLMSGLTLWYWPAVLYKFTPGLAKEAQTAEPQWFHWVRRSFGIFPFSLALLSFWKATNYSLAKLVQPGPILQFAGIGILLLFFIGRKNRFKKSYEKDSQNQSYFKYLYVKMSGDAERFITPYEGLFITITTLISFSILAIVSFFPAFSTHLAIFFGAPALIFFAIGMIVPGSSLLIWLTRPAKIPLTAAVLLLLAGSSFVNDVHRIIPSRAKGPERPTLDQAFATWKSLHQPNDPIIIVAAPGGASRAAYWTGTMLAALDSASEGKFTQNVFAISSVSGGSLGAYDYAAWLSAVPAECRGTPMAHAFVQQVLGKDYLAPVVAGMFYPNLAQLFSPVQVFPSRGVFLEEGFRQGWNTKLTRVTEAQGIAKNCQPPADALARDYTTPWTNPIRGAGWVPLVFANSTHVETGRRVLFSPVRAARGQPNDEFYETFLNAYDFTGDFAAGRGIDAASAIHNSARFPIVSPAGRLPLNCFGDQQGHLVDGGYFDSSGLVTAYDLARYLAGLSGQTHPIFILDLDNVDTADPADLDRFDEPEHAVVPTAEASLTQVNSTGPPLYEAWLIGQGFIGTWAARQQYEAKRLSEFTNGATPVAGRANVHYLRLGLPLPGPDAVPVALNWVLSPSMRKRMDEYGAALAANATAGDQAKRREILNCKNAADCPSARMLDAMLDTAAAQAEKRAKRP